MLALLFSCPGPDWQEQIAELAASLSDTPLQQAAAQGAKRSEQGNVPYGVRPRWTGRAAQVSCQQTTLSGRFLAALRDLYSAFAHDSQTGELPDHVATAPISTATCG